MFGIDTKIPVLLVVLMGLKTTDFYCPFLQSRKIIKELECHANSSF